MQVTTPEIEVRIVEKEQPVVAIFDIDKTVLPGFTIIDFARFLSEQGRFSMESMQTIDELLRVKHTMTYNEFADRIVETYAQGIKGQSVEDVAGQSELFWKDRFKTIFPYVHTVFASLEEVGARRVAISGSTEESLAPFLRAFGFDQDSVTTKMVCEHGVYTGEVRLNAASEERKREIVSELFGHIPPGTRTIGFGDSVADLAFLERVDTAVVIGKDEDLLKVGSLRGWSHIPNPKTETLQS